MRGRRDEPNEREVQELRTEKREFKVSSGSILEEIQIIGAASRPRTSSKV